MHCVLVRSVRTSHACNFQDTGGNESQLAMPLAGTKNVITDSCSMYSSFHSLQQPPWGNCPPILNENSAVQSD